jgi:hypothetical protein
MKIYKLIKKKPGSKIFQEAEKFRGKLKKTIITSKNGKIIRSEKR